MLNRLLELLFSDKQKEELEQKKIVAAYQNVFKSEYGEIVLADLAKNCHMFDTSADASLIQFREGERNVMLRILSIINMDLDALNKAEGQSKQEFSWD